jgi:hypothetical protein
MKKTKPKATKPTGCTLAAHPRPRLDPDKPKPVVPIADPKPVIA